MGSLLKTKVVSIFLLIVVSSFPFLSRAAEKSFYFGFKTNSINKMGFYLNSVNPDSVGWYSSVGFSTPSVPDSQVVDISQYAAEVAFNDQYKGPAENIVGLNFGITKKIYEELYLIGALAFTMRSQFRKYYDNLGILGDRGNYAIKTGSSTETGLEVGLQYNLTKFEPPPAVSITYETTLQVVSFGIGFGF